jgi:copper resistance protein B
MKRLLLVMAATALTASPAVAQMNMKMPGMHMPRMKMPSQKKKAPAKKKGSSRKSSAKAKTPAKKTTPENPGAHDDGAMPSMPGMEMPQGETMQNMPGMQMPPGQSMRNMPGMNMPSGEHAGHDMAGMSAPEPPLAPPPAEALKGPENAADTVYGTAAMQPSRTTLTKEHGGMTASKLLVDQLETRVRRGRDGYYVNAEGWYGGDIDKLWLKSEIEGDYGRSADQMEFQALWSHALDPWFNLQTGIRFDAEPRTRGRLVLGVEGLAPYWWEVNAAAFVSDKGDVTARAEAEHDVRITQKLILQPRAELDFALQDIPHERVGSGLSNVELGARLRYRFLQNFAPYVGVVYERAIGRSARFVRADGERPGGLQFTVGLRTWF